MLMCIGKLHKKLMKLRKLHSFLSMTYMTGNDQLLDHGNLCSKNILSSNSWVHIPAWFALKKKKIKKAWNNIEVSDSSNSVLSPLLSLFLWNSILSTWIPMNVFSTFIAFGGKLKISERYDLHLCFFLWLPFWPKSPSCSPVQFPSLFPDEEK